MSHVPILECEEEVLILLHFTRGGDEFPRAFVVRNNKSVTQDELQTFIQTRFARHKWLTGGVFFIESIPRNSTGKILRRELPNPIESKF